MTPSLMRRALLLAALALPAALPTHAQDAAAKSPTYDAVSIKPNKDGGDDFRINKTPEGYRALNISLKYMIQSAYNLISDDQIDGISGPLASARFDIQAKADAETAALLRKLPLKERRAMQCLMLQAMLTDRFQLKVHHKTKEAAVYGLVVAKSGSRLKPADPTRADTDGPRTAPDSYRAGTMSSTVDDHIGAITGQAVPLSGLADALGVHVGRVVLDKTGLVGNFDFTFQWTESSGAENGDDTKAPPLFTALQEQLGLRLESMRGPVEVVVVDHAESPSEN